MGFNDQGKEIFNEQVTAYERYLDKVNSEKMGGPKKQPYVFEDWKTVDIGEGTPYPVMLAGYKVPIVVNPVTNEVPVKQFQGEEDLEKFFTEGGVPVKSFVEGDKLDNGTEAPLDRKYVVSGGKKYCLPSKEWVKIHTDKKYVYKFTNPKTDKTYSVAIQLAPQIIVDGKTIKGSEAARQCYKGSAGWEFVLKTKPPTVFYYKPTGQEVTKGDARLYDPNKDAGPNSEFDDWWDSGWGLAIELTIGIAAGFLTAGAATGLLALARAGQLGARLGSLVIYLGETAYFSGSVSLLEPIVGSLLEAGLMGLPTYYNYERGNTSDATLGLIFCFLPFFTELPALKRAFATGKFTKTEAEVLGREIVEKMNKAGGVQTISASETATLDFISTLSPKAQIIFTKTMEDLGARENATIVEKGMKLVIAKNSDEIVEQLAKKPDTVLGKAAEMVKNNVNIPLGKGIIPTFVRTGVPIFGMTIGFLKIFNHLTNQGVSNKGAEAYAKALKEGIEKNEYFQALAQLSKDLGYGPPLMQDQIDEIGIRIYDNDPKLQATLIEDERVEENIIQPKLEIETQKEKERMTSVWNETVIESVKKKDEFIQNYLKRKVLRNLAKVTTNTPVDVVTLIIKELGYEIQSWTETTSETEWKFITKKQENGTVVFQSEDKTIIKINDIEIVS